MNSNEFFGEILNTSKLQQGFRKSVKSARLSPNPMRAVESGLCVTLRLANQWRVSVN